MGFGFFSGNKNTTPVTPSVDPASLPQDPAVATPDLNPVDPISPADPVAETPHAEESWTLPEHPITATPQEAPSEPAAETPSAPLITPDLPTLDMEQLLNSPEDTATPDTSAGLASISNLPADFGFPAPASATIPAAPEPEAPSWSPAESPEPAPSDSQPEEPTDSSPTPSSDSEPTEQPKEELKEGEDAFPETVTGQVQKFLDQNMENERAELQRLEGELKQNETLLKEQREKLEQMRLDISRQEAEMHKKEVDLEHAWAVWEHRKSRIEKVLTDLGGN